MSESIVPGEAPPPDFQSPPLSAMPAREPVDPRLRLDQLAQQLINTRNRGVLMEFLQLRRSLR